MNMPSTVLNNNRSFSSGMLLFLSAEMLFFGLLFIVYLAYRISYAQAFHFASGGLSLARGTVSTVILLISSATLAKSFDAIRQDNKRLAQQLTGITILLGILFLLTGCFEWQQHIRAGIYPASSVLALRGPGDVLFYGLYFFITGLHALHVIIGLAVIGFLMRGIIRGKTDSGNYDSARRKGLYWYLVVIIWVFIFPLFYLIT